MESRTRPLFAAVNTKCHSTYPSRVQGSQNSFQSVQSITSCYTQVRRFVVLLHLVLSPTNIRLNMSSKRDGSISPDSHNICHDSHKLVKSGDSKGGQGTTPP